MRSIVFSAASLVLVAACSNPEPRLDAPGQSGAPTVSSHPATHAPNHAPSATSHTVPASDGPSTLVPIEAPTAAAVAGANRFGFDLYHRIATNPGNQAFSPASIALALGMTYAGAQGATATQMASVLHAPAEPGALHEAWATIANAWAKATDVELGLANRLFGAKTEPLKTAFVDLVAQRYGAPLELLDFEHAPDASRVHINDWVAGRTHDRIRDLIPEGQIDDTTRLVLTNALYFKATWQGPFDVARTRPLTFHAADGAAPSVPFMHQAEVVRYAALDDVELVELPYKGGRFAALFALPKARDGLAAVEAALDGARFERWVGALASRYVSVALPRFKVAPDAPLALGEHLKGLGMVDAFDAAAADFTGMGAPGLFVKSVFHKAFVAMDEAGSEAAAATAVVMGGESAVAEPETAFEADHPFLYFIRDVQTGLVMFAGRVANPS